MAFFFLFFLFSFFLKLLVLEHGVNFVLPTSEVQRMQKYMKVGGDKDKEAITVSCLVNDQFVNLSGPKKLTWLS